MQLLALLHLVFIVEAKRNQPRDKSGLQKLSRPPQRLSNPYDIYQHPIPIDFINMGKEGILDPSTGLKQPIDLLALTLRSPNSPEEEERMLKNADPRNILRIAKKPKFSVPRSEPYAISVREYNPHADEKKNGDVYKVVANAEMPMPFDFEKTLTINAALPDVYRDNIAKANSMFRSGTPDVQSEPGYDGNGTDPNFAVNVSSRNMFDLRPEFSRHPDNWTTCEEFAVNARFHPREVAGVNWVVFYKWALRDDVPRDSDFEFSYPTKQVVQKYKTEFGPFLDERIDWKQPMLLLKTWMMEFLLVAGDRRGLFYGIPKHEIPEEAKKPTLKVPIITFRMKMVDPYLAVMLCEDLTALMLATVEEVPAVEHMEREAAKLGFTGNGTIIIKTKDDEMIHTKSVANIRNDEPVTEDTSFYEAPKYQKTPFFNDDPFVT